MTDNLIQLTEEVRSCTLCDLCQSRRQAVPGHGYLSARLFVLAEKPGVQEDRSGVPMVGEAGKLFTSLLAKAGLKRSDCYVTNLVKCLPPYKHRLTLQELDSCRPYLERELALLKPRVVLALGNLAAAVWFPPSPSPGMDNRIGSIHGRPRTVFTDWGHTIIMPSYHPAAALRQEQLVDIIARDFLTLAKILESLPEPDTVEWNPFTKRAS